MGQQTHVGLMSGSTDSCGIDEWVNRLTVVHPQHQAQSQVQQNTPTPPSDPPDGPGWVNKGFDVGGVSSTWWSYLAVLVGSKRDLMSRLVSFALVGSTKMSLESPGSGESKSSIRSCVGPKLAAKI